ncbi:AraC-type DNA-binding protein [Arachidicoccus rhizosphaerae]|uniref:AraC-type DNA-binding protein n=1 Tax=Arachidicoccus rhizosphaerae TaxID=551991 RepID=A0A1H3WNR2_9BACT|nr:AraC family transcriptional regulator [Arachidicoccus rhizosphaerae]SDZ88773.1 AraC-type DNA-binding protein [Arachidicoccus rhizosphaerae]
MLPKKFIAKQQIQIHCHYLREDHKDQLHSEHVIYHLISGTIKFLDNKKEYICKEGDYWYCYKNQFLKYQKIPQDRDTPCKFIRMELDEQLLKKIAREKKLRSTWMEKQAGVIMIKNNLSMQEIFASFINNESNTMTVDPDATLAKMEKAAMIVLEQHPQLKNALFDFNQPTRKVFDDFMQNNFMFNVSLKAFAYMSGRSISTFKRDFIKTFKMPPKKWLVEKRMQNAYYMISEKGKRSREIYFLLGFGSESNFCFAFKKYFGFNPSQVKDNKIVLGENGINKFYI